MRFSLVFFTLVVTLVLSNCGGPVGGYTVAPPNMDGPTVAERNAQIAAEEPGSYYIGRRYYTKNTRFWGYLRKPRQPWSQAKLVMMNEWSKKAPDRLPETRNGGYGYDNNYEYRISGNYTGDKVYEPNSDQFLPEFRLKGYKVIDKDPGWIFTPADRYDPMRVTLIP